MPHKPSVNETDVADLADRAEDLMNAAISLSDRAERGWGAQPPDKTANSIRLINATVRALAQLNGVLMARMAMDLDREGLRRELLG